MADKLVRLFADILGVGEGQLNDETAPGNTPEWDSHSNIMLVTELEDLYKIDLSTQEIESMTTIGRVRALLRERGALDA